VKSSPSRERIQVRVARRLMRVYGNVSIPQEAFIAALRMGEE
jgi:translation elongation factor EF-4